MAAVVLIVAVLEVGLLGGGSGGTDSGARNNGGGSRMVMGWQGCTLSGVSWIGYLIGNSNITVVNC